MILVIFPCPRVGKKQEHFLLGWGGRNKTYWPKYSVLIQFTCTRALVSFRLRCKYPSLRTTFLTSTSIVKRRKCPFLYTFLKYFFMLRTPSGNDVSILLYILFIRILLSYLLFLTETMQIPFLTYYSYVFSHLTYTPS